VCDGRVVERAAVEDSPPPRALLKIFNPVVKAILRSPLHRLMSKQLMVLTVTGRRTGRTYSIPVGRHPAGDGSFIVSAGGTWRHNLHGGADVLVTLDRRERRGHAVLEEDADKAAEELKALIDRNGPRSMAFKIHVDRAPTVAEVRSAIADRGVAYLRLTD
jgi:hypothetical protein